MSELELEVSSYEDDSEDVPEELSKLRSDLLSLGLNDLENLDPSDFEMTLFTMNDSRTKILMKALQKPYSRDIFWSVKEDSIGEVMHKCVWVCHHWELESNPRIVRGVCSKEENMRFWEKVAAEVPILMQNPESTGRNLELSLLENESSSTWEEIIAVGFENVRCNKESKGRYPITLTNVMDLETLHKNGMTETDSMEKLRKDVETSMESLGSPSGYVLEGIQKKCSKALGKGEELRKAIDDFLHFMQNNNNFDHNKSNFAIAYADSVLKVMKKILTLQRDFMAEVVALQKNRSSTVRQ